MATAMATSANAQHNLLALQAQLQALQGENATLTNALSLKENALLQRERQLRVLQQRMEELEGGVAAWKDRYLQQLTHNSQAQQPHDEWAAVALPPPSGAQVLPNADVMGSLVEKLSTADREKLKTLIGMERTRGQRTARTPWDESFVDVSPEMQSVIMQYLLPVLLETQRVENQRTADDGPPPGHMAIHCLTRSYTKTATDVKIVCQLVAPGGDASAAAAFSAYRASSSLGSDDGAAATSSSRGGFPTAAALNAMTIEATPTGGFRYSGSFSPAQIPAVGGAAVSLLGSSPSTSSSPLSTAMAEKLPPAEEHLFDCVDCENAKRTAPVSHGPREIHPSKAVYISKPLASPGTSSAASTATATSSSSSSSLSAAAAMRRYSLAPNKSASAAADVSRTQTVGSGMSLTGYPSSSSSASRMDAFSMGDTGMDGDRRSGASSGSLTGSAPPPHPHKDAGKIKKIMGSVMKGLNRHKPQLTLTNPQLEEEDDSICDGCGRGPLAGVKWVCRTCKVLKEQEYELCDKCYGQGLHGKENEDALFERIEEIVVAKCPKLAREQDLMKLLRVGICKANLKKYSFCLTWIADLLLCKATKDLRARALEISQISPQVRSEFVRLLTELLAKHRRNIELITEWQPVQNVASSSSSIADLDGTGSSMLQLDTLRIWVKDVVVDS